MDEGKIGNVEMICLLVNAIACKAFFTSVAAVVEKVGTAGWYMVLISDIVAIGVFSQMYALSKAYPGKNLLEIYDDIVGKKVGKVLSFISCIMLFVTVSITLREFTDATNVYLLHESPPGFIVGMFIIAMVTVCFLGIEGLGRVAKFLSFILLFNFLIVMVLSYRTFQGYKLFPILGYGLGNTVRHGIMRSSAFGEFILLGVFAKALNNTKDLGKIGYKSLIIGGLIISIVLFSVIISFPYYVTTELADPLYIMVSLIQYGRFFQRIEVVFIFTWNLSTLIGLTAIFYGSIICYCHVFNIKDKKPIIISFGISTYISTLIVPSISIILDYIVPIFRGYGWIGFYTPIFISWAIWLLFRRGKQTNVEKS
ncbi:GerAB/ArcD/ProY family transporter [Lutispora thermophila]|uniref:Spore germination protein (Amino acid permease) n=1 Tax=Lutispora thermophila DSM 19022 TaxID=1122184 RepID=A0A1M6DU34_9FIRM|nr:endospore germination permease [Lutispora thermophila]SHI76712.1 spore germination protein (amino acid permease) [Lutispora thermophila DSM 19022]